MFTALLIIAGVAALALVWVARRKRAIELPSSTLPRDDATESAQPKPSTEPSAALEAPAEDAREPAESHEDISVESFPPEEPAQSPPKPPASEAEMASLRAGLKMTRKGFVGRLAALFRGKKEIPEALFDDVEEVLVTADIGIKTTTKLLDKLRDRVSQDDLQDGDRLFDALREDATAILTGPASNMPLSGSPCVILVIGVNGVGKTTTIGKLASRYSDQGHKVILGAGDTFRAAAVLQLQKWGERVGCEIVSGDEGADPSSVIFDSIKRGIDSGADIVICDTAGRLHTKAPLMEELVKVGRTAEKALGRPADHVLLVLDATTGQNAIQQTDLFKQALPVNGLVLTKLDGTAKGGVILGIVDEHQIPVQYIGIGEKVEDLRTFDANAFAKALFEKPDEDTIAA